MIAESGSIRVDSQTDAVLPETIHCIVVLQNFWTVVYRKPQDIKDWIIFLIPSMAFWQISIEASSYVFIYVMLFLQKQKKRYDSPENIKGNKKHFNLFCLSHISSLACYD